MSEPLFPNPTFTPARWLLVALVLVAGLVWFFLRGLDAEPILRVGGEVLR